MRLIPVSLVLVTSLLLLVPFRGSAEPEKDSGTQIVYSNTPHGRMERLVDCIAISCGETFLERGESFLDEWDVRQNWIHNSKLRDAIFEVLKKKTDPEQLDGLESLSKQICPAGIPLDPILDIVCAAPRQPSRGPLLDYGPS